MTNQTDTTTPTTTPAYDIASLASALIMAHDALLKVRTRICFLGEMMGDKEDGLTLSSNAFDELQEYLLQTAGIAGEVADSNFGDYYRAKDIMDKVTMAGAG